VGWGYQSVSQADGDIEEILCRPDYHGSFSAQTGRGVDGIKEIIEGNIPECDKITGKEPRTYQTGEAID